MKLHFIFLLLIANHTGFTQNINQDSAWFRNNYYKIEKAIPMRDGIKLFTSIYVPRDSSEKHPILMQRTPYSCAPYGIQEFLSLSGNYIMNYLKEGYILVIQDVRGRWMSEGKFVDVRPFIKVKKRRIQMNLPMHMTQLTGSLKTFLQIMVKLGCLALPIRDFTQQWQRLQGIRH
jgi:hypothetical protein